MEEKIFSKCGMRCDLCFIYRPNVEKEDRRTEICNAWKKIWQGFEPDPKTVICDGCCSESKEAVLFSPNCEARNCVIEKGHIHCGYCEQYPCSIFPAEPTKEETIRKIEVEQQWTWEDEKLMEAYACKKHMDEFRNGERRVNNQMCPCKRTKCERHGNCAECRTYHHSKSSGKSLTRCEKLKKKEQKRTDKQGKSEQ